MWVQIRKPPPMQVNKEGGISYIASGFSNQYGVETQILAVICKDPIYLGCSFGNSCKY